MTTIQAALVEAAKLATLHIVDSENILEFDMTIGIKTSQGLVTVEVSATALANGKYSIENIALNEQIHRGELSL